MKSYSFSLLCAGIFVAGLVFLTQSEAAQAAPPLGYRVAKAIAGPMDTNTPTQKGLGLFAGRQQETVADTKATAQPTAAPQDKTGAKPADTTRDSDFVEGLDLGDNCCNPLACCPESRFWLRADYLMWWTSGTRLPALVSDGPIGSGSVLYGDNTIANDGRSGYRTTVGVWLGQCHNWALEFDYLDLGERNNDFTATSLGETTIVRPFFDLLSNRQSGYAVAGVDSMIGTVSVNAHEYFNSAGALLSRNIFNGPFMTTGCEDECTPAVFARTDLLFGFRYYGLSDYVGVYQNSMATTGEIFQLSDNFRTRNEFYGSEVGFRTRLQRNRWSLEFLTKVAVGNTHEAVEINGQSTYTAADGASQTVNGGLLAVGSNSGKYNRDVFTMIPQIGFELGYEVNCHWRAYVGYNLLYWGTVRRAADQIDTNIDTRNVPLSPDCDPASAIPYPHYLDRANSFWAQGINIGTEFRF